MPIQHPQQWLQNYDPHSVTQGYLSRLAGTDSGYAYPGPAVQQWWAQKPLDQDQTPFLNSSQPPWQQLAMGQMAGGSFNQQGVTPPQPPMHGASPYLTAQEYGMAGGTTSPWQGQGPWGGGWSARGNKGPFGESGGGGGKKSGGRMSDLYGGMLTPYNNAGFGGQDEG